MNKRLLKNIEWGILICTILLIVIGFVALFSATQNAGYDEFKKQIMWVLVSIPVMIVVILIDYEIFIKISPVLYGASLIFLIGVLFTEPINGASSWFSIGKFTVQPAEFAKIAFVYGNIFSNYYNKYSFSIYNVFNIHVVCFRNKEKIHYNSNCNSCDISTSSIFFYITRTCKNENRCIFKSGYGPKRCWII